MLLTGICCGIFDYGLLAFDIAIAAQSHLTEFQAHYHTLCACVFVVCDYAWSWLEHAVQFSHHHHIVVKI